MLLNEQEFNEAKERGEFGSAITYRRYLAFMDLRKRTQIAKQSRITAKDLGIHIH